MDHYGLVRTPVPIPKVMKIPAANASVDTDCDKLKNVLVWSESKVRANAHVMHEAQKQKDLYTLFSNDGCKPLEALRVGSTFFKTYKGRVVLHGDTVQDGTGCQAAFQMTAAKVVGTIFRVLGIGGEGEGRSRIAEAIGD